MRVTNWRKKVYASLVSAGLIMPQVAYAVDIPLGDSSFEVYPVASNPGYAYSNEYAGISAWIDDQDNPSENRFENDGDSNWLYIASYGEIPPNVRPAARTGLQAMHGLSNYNTQEVATLFEAGKTYTFSLYAQGDSNPVGGDDHAWLYIFDGNTPFSEENSLAFAEYSPADGHFIDRPVNATPVQSKALWQQINISHTVAAGAAEIGHPVGVGFFGRRDVAFDDASLSVDTTILILEVNTSNGHVRIVNETGKPVHLNYYEITSSNDSLRSSTWSSLQDQDLTGFPAVNGFGDGWEEAGGASDSAIGESFLFGSSQLAASGLERMVGLGTAYALGDPHDLVFRYGDLAPASLKADFDNDGDVDGRDFLIWQRGVGTSGVGATRSLGNANTDLVVNAADLAIWQEEYGNTSTTLPSTSTLKMGHVRYVPSGFLTAVPEPSSILLVGLGMGALIVSSGRKCKTPTIVRTNRA